MLRKIGTVHTRDRSYKLQMTLKSTLLLIFSFGLLQLTFGQEKMKIKKSENGRLIKALNNARLIGENRENFLSVRIYKIDNGSGSAEFEEGHEVSHNLLIAVSEFDEEPNQSLFEVGPLINPVFVEWIEIKEYERRFEIEYGIHNSRETRKLKVNINELKLVK